MALLAGCQFLRIRRSGSPQACTEGTVVCSRSVVRKVGYIRSLGPVARRGKHPDKQGS